MYDQAWGTSLSFLEYGAEKSLMHNQIFDLLKLDGAYIVETQTAYCRKGADV